MVAIGVQVDGLALPPFVALGTDSTLELLSVQFRSRDAVMVSGVPPAAADMTFHPT